MLKGFITDARVIVNSLLKGATSTFHAVIKGCRGKSKRSHSSARTHGLTIEINATRNSSVLVLLLNSCPSTIVGLVVPVTILSLYRGPSRTNPHILKKIVKSFPSFAYRYTSRAVSFVRCCIEIFTSCKHSRPTIVSRSVRKAVSSSRLSGLEVFGEFATARSCVSGFKAAIPYGKGFPAFAGNNAPVFEPVDADVPRFMIGNRKPSKYRSNWDWVSCWHINNIEFI